MIIVKLSGGLGNQLFQYATGRALAIRKKTGLCFDTSNYGREEAGVIRRGIALQHFQVEGTIATPHQLRKLLQPSLLSKLARKIFALPSVYYRERFFHFDPEVLETGTTVLLDGYWQSEKYFKAIAPVVRKDLRVISPLSAETRAMADRIANTRSVSLHVRRGDYVNDPKTLSYHGVCEPGYYTKAIAALKERVGEMEIFVFSDDMDWAKENISTEFPMTFVNHPGRQDYEDLYLMSLCRHNIIANSSFSWWGAWLNINPGKAVVAPARWFNESNADTKDLLPPEWLKV